MMSVCPDQSLATYVDSRLPCHIPGRIGCFGLGHQVVHLQMVDIDAWSRRVRSVSSLDEVHSAVRAFERNVSWAVQSESRTKRAARSRVRSDPCHADVMLIAPVPFLTNPSTAAALSSSIEQDSFRQAQAHQDSNRKGERSQTLSSSPKRLKTITQGTTEDPSRLLSSRLSTSEAPRYWQGPEPGAARLLTAAEVATSSTPAASISSQAAGSSKGRKHDLQHGRCDEKLELTAWVSLRFPVSLSTIQALTEAKSFVSLSLIQSL